MGDYYGEDWVDLNLFLSHLSISPSFHNDHGRPTQSTGLRPRKRTPHETTHVTSVVGCPRGKGLFSLCQRSVDECYRRGGRVQERDGRRRTHPSVLWNRQEKREQGVSRTPWVRFERVTERTSGDSLNSSPLLFGKGNSLVERSKWESGYEETHT